MKLLGGFKMIKKVYTAVVFTKLIRNNYFKKLYEDPGLVQMFLTLRKFLQVGSLLSKSYDKLRVGSSRTK